MLNSILLAISVSLDSLGIGVTYGIKNIKIHFLAKCLLFAISICCTFFSFFIGGYINMVLSTGITRLISSSILIILGITIIIDPIPFDFNHSKAIDLREAFFLGIAISLDSVCVGIVSSIGGFLVNCFPILVSVFQMLFLSIGSYLGRCIKTKFQIPEIYLKLLSGMVLIIFGIIKVFG